MKKFNNSYKQLIRLKKNYDQAGFSTRTAFKCTLTAAFSKSLEFNHQINCEASDKENFFLTPVLRGLCEDLIVLKFIRQEIGRDQNRLILELMALEIVKNIEAQDNFFRVNKPYQPVLSKTIKITSPTTGIFYN